MKKLLVLFIGFVMAFALISCGGESLVPDYEAFESQLSMPVDLAVDDSAKSLSWAAVENASGYVVYVNGEKQDDVNDTSYDFSDLTENVIKFNVVAKGPKGYTDSQMSTSVAFVANRDAEVNLLVAELSDSDMYFEDEQAFAEELVNKGMLASDFEVMVTSIESLEDIQEMNSFSDIFDSIDGALESMDLDEIEAFVSATIKAELLVSLKDDLDEYRNYYSSEVILQKQAMIDFLEENGDEAVRSIMVVIEYIMDVESAMTDAMVTDMESLMDNVGTSQFDASVFINLKDDLVNSFIENLPAIDDVILLNTTLYTLADMVSGEELDLSNGISIPKTSAQMLMSAELFFNFFLAIDEDYVEAAMELAMTPNYVNNQKTFVKENIDLISEFLDEQEDLIDDMNDIFTDEEKEDLFYETMVMIQGSLFTPLMMVMPGYTSSDSDLMDDIETIYKNNIDFADLVILQEAMGDNFKALLDGIIDSDYAIIDSTFDIINYIMYNQKSNEYSDLLMAVLEDGLDLINPIVQDFDTKTFDAFVSYLIGTYKSQFEIMALYEPDMDGIDYSVLLTAIEDGLIARNDEVIGLVQSVFELAATTEYLSDILNYSESIYEDEDAIYAILIESANMVNDLESEISGDIDGIVSELSTVLQNPDLMSTLGLTSSGVTDLIDDIETYVEDVFEAADKIKDYDYQSLTEAQMEDVESFMDVFSLMF